MSAGRRPDAAALLARALLRDAASAGCAVELTGARTRPWASATFVGERVTLDLRPGGATGAWAASLPEADLAMAGWIVADLAVEATPGGLTVAALVLRAA